MRICWDNLEKVRKYYSTSGTFYIGRPNVPLNMCAKYWYMDSCNVCGEPFLAGKRSGSFDLTCSLECARVGKGNPAWKHGLAKDPEHVRELDRIRYKTGNKYERNKLNYYNNAAKYRARKNDAVVPESDQDLIKAIYALCAEYNKYDPDTKYEVDHIKPISKGGKHCDANLQILTQFANRSKGASMCQPCEEVMPYRSRLYSQ